MALNERAGGLGLPGFRDAHVQPVQGGRERMRRDLSEITTRDGYLAAVRSFPDARPDLLWVRDGRLVDGGVRARRHRARARPRGPTSTEAGVRTS